MENIRFDFSDFHQHGRAFYEFLQLRKKVFVDDLKWDVPHNSSVEMDQYDTPLAHYSLVLRDVCYIIRADIVLKPQTAEPMQKYLEMFIRRASKGQAFHQPYLGNREFTAFFSLPEDEEMPIDHSEDLGRMLFDMQFQEVDKGRLKYRTHDGAEPRWATGNATPRFFSARLERGVLHVPRQLYGEEG